MDVGFDDAIISAVGCAPQQDSACNPAFRAGTTRVTGASAGGLVGDTLLAEVTFECADAEGASELQLTLIIIADATMGGPQPVDPSVMASFIVCGSPQDGFPPPTLTPPPLQLVPPRIVSPGCEPPSVQVDERVFCDPTITGDFDSVSWSAPGGSSPIGRGISFSTSYGSAGSRTIMLEACNAAGCSSGSQIIIVSPPEPPFVASLGCEPLEVEIGEVVTCIPSISGVVENISWSAPGGLPPFGNETPFLTNYGTAGTKTIMLEACNAAGCSSGSQIIIVSPPAAVCQDDPLEDNDTPDAATALGPFPLAVLPQPATSCPNDDDWYSFFLSAEQRLLISAFFSHAEGDIDIHLYDPAGSPVASSTSASDNEEIFHTATSDGIYTLRVFLYSDSGGFLGNSYDLEVTIPESGLSPPVQLQ